MWTQYTVELELAQRERMLAEAAKTRLLKMLPQAQSNPWQKATRRMEFNRLWVLLVLLAALLLVGWDAKPAPVPVIPADVQASDLTGWHNCEFQPESNKTK